MSPVLEWLTGVIFAAVFFALSVGWAYAWRIRRVMPANVCAFTGALLAVLAIISL